MSLTIIKKTEISKLDSFNKWKQNPSKGEVFTPKELVNEILDQIPVEVWKNSKSTFCDLSMGKGTFLVEIVKRLVYIYGYKEEDAKSRVFGYEIRVKYVNYLKRRGYKNVFFKDSLIEVFKMKFDVAIGNSPYQKNDGGGTGSSAVPIYNKFVEKCLEISDNVLLITPSRWFNGGKGLDGFREMMFNRRDIKFIKHFANEKTWFDIELPGGVSYFYIQKTYSGTTQFIDFENNLEYQTKLNNYDIFIPNLVSRKIVDKVVSKDTESFSNKVLSRKPFDVQSNFKNWTEYGVEIFTKDGIKKICENSFKDKFNIINKFKVLISKADGAAYKSKRVISRYNILEPGSISTETYLVCFTSFDKKECVNVGNYLMTKFARYMLLLRMSGQNNSKDKFKWVPVMDFTKEWKDSDLYKYFDLTEEEIEEIEKNVK
jgi:site-specific DNA-methyltransferase (adenine-specific)